MTNWVKPSWRCAAYITKKLVGACLRLFEIGLSGGIGGLLIWTPFFDLPSLWGNLRQRICQTVLGGYCREVFQVLYHLLPSSFFSFLSCCWSCIRVLDRMTSFRWCLALVLMNVVLLMRFFFICLSWSFTRSGLFTLLESSLTPNLKAEVVKYILYVVFVPLFVYLAVLVFVFWYVK